MTLTALSCLAPLVVPPAAAEPGDSITIAQYPYPPRRYGYPQYPNYPQSAGYPQTPYQAGAQSTYLQGGAGSTTLQGGTGSTTLQGGTGSTMLQTGTQGTMIQGNIEQEAGPVNILFLLDASYSMKEKLGGEVQKMDAAKQVLQEAMSKIPTDVNVGLRVFGHARMGDPSLDCRASMLLVPLGRSNRGSIIRRVREVIPSGMTPLTYAIQQAAEDDFRGIAGRKVLILISDGEDTCGGDPCRYIATLSLRGIKLKVDVVGVDLKRAMEAKRQLNCISQMSGGKYYDANTASELIKSVSASVNQAVSGRVIIKPSAPEGSTTDKPTPNPINTETPVELQSIDPIKAP